MGVPRGNPGGTHGIQLSDLPREIGAGLIAALSAVTSCFVYGALIFSGPLHPYLSEGITASLLTCAATALVVALVSSFRTAIAVPVASISALFAVLMASLGPVIEQTPLDQRLALVMTALFATTAATAIALLLVGFLRAGMLVRFVPYPVIAGFLGATGWLIIAGAVKMTTGIAIGFSTLTQLTQDKAGIELLLLLGWTAVLWVATKKIKNPLVLPAGLVLASLAFNFALPLFGVSIADAQQQGFFFSIDAAAWSGIPAINGDYFRADWTALLSVSGEIGAIVLIAVVQTLFLATGLELATRTEVNLDHELRSLGWANLTSAAAGGYVGQISISLTTANRSAGGTSRIGGIVVSFVALLCLLGAGSVLGYVPQFVLGGALLLQGIRLIDEWVLKTYRRLPLLEWLLIIAIIIITAWFGFIPAEFGGLLISCLFFALSVSRIDIARPVYGLNARTSSSMRSEREMRSLAEHGSRVQVIELRGFIFFGSTNRLRNKVKALLAEHRPLMLIFDFSRVVGIDSSAATTMVGISHTLADQHIAQRYVALSPMISGVFREAGGLDKEAVILSDIDQALEHGEMAVLTPHVVGPLESPSLQDWLSEAFGNSEHAAILQKVMTRRLYASEDYLCHHGDSTNELFFIETGRVSAILGKNVSAPTRVRGFGPNMIVGEIAFVLNVPRTASLRVDEEAVVWSLSRDEFEKLVVAQPELVFALMQSMLQIQVERLSFATRQIAALRV